MPKGKKKPDVERDEMISHSDAEDLFMVVDWLCTQAFQPNDTERRDACGRVAKRAKEILSSRGTKNLVLGDIPDVVSPPPQEVKEETADEKEATEEETEESEPPKMPEVLQGDNPGAIEIREKLEQESGKKKGK